MTTTTIPTPRPPVAQSAPVAQCEPEMVTPRRGEVWMVTTGATPAVGAELWSGRPAVIISNNTVNGRAGFANVVYLTTSAKRQSSPTHVPMASPCGVNSISMAICEQIHCVDASRLVNRMDVVPRQTMEHIDSALTVSLALGKAPSPHSLFAKWERQMDQHGVDLAAEIAAMSGTTTDQRIESLTRALELVTARCNALATLQQTDSAIAQVMLEVEKAQQDHQAQGS